MQCMTMRGLQDLRTQYHVLQWNQYFTNSTTNICVQYAQLPAAELLMNNGIFHPIAFSEIISNIQYFLCCSSLSLPKLGPRLYKPIRIQDSQNTSVNTEYHKKINRPQTMEDTVIRHRPLNNQNIRTGKLKNI